MMRFIPVAFLLLLLCAGFSSSRKINDEAVAVNDTTQREFRCVLDSLGIGEAYTIIYHSTGCFHSLQDSIWIARTYAGFTAMYHGTKKTLNAQETEAIREFEYEVNKVTKIDGGCTTTDYFRYKRENKTYIAGHDDTCKYTTFQDLLDDLKFSTR